MSAGRKALEDRLMRAERMFQAYGGHGVEVELIMAKLALERWDKKTAQAEKPKLESTL